jgi:hypothetical protein
MLDVVVIMTGVLLTGALLAETLLMGALLAGVLLIIEMVVDELVSVGLLEIVGTNVATPELLGRVAAEPVLDCVPDPTRLGVVKNGDGVSLLLLSAAGTNSDTLLAVMAVEEMAGVTDPVGASVNELGVVAAA